MSDEECVKRARERGHPDDCGCDWCCFGTVMLPAPDARSDEKGDK